MYKKLGLSEQGILNHFTGAVFQPWNRMGNIKGWGGPITLSYLWKDLQLNKKVSVGGLFDLDCGARGGAGHASRVPRVLRLRSR